MSMHIAESMTITTSIIIMMTMKNIMRTDIIITIIMIIAM